VAILSTQLPTIRQLQCFVAVAQELSFRRAAERLSLSQPPLSRHIKALEDLLRVKLVERDTHRVTLTTVGEAFEREAHQLLIALDRATQAVRHDASEQTSELRFGISSVIDPALNDVLAPPLAELTGSPRVRVVRAYSKSLMARVGSGELDFAIVGDVPFESESREIRALTKEPLMVALPARHPAAGLPCVDPPDLADTVLFWFRRNDNPQFYDRCEEVFVGSGFNPVRRPEPEDHAELLASVASGAGMAFLPTSMRAASHTGVTYVPLSPAYQARLFIQLQLVWRTEESRADVLGTVALILRCCGQRPTPFMPSGV
jgi:DNA-binding transcriptional LysR family regulator